MSDFALVVVNFGSSDLLAANLVDVHSQAPHAHVIVVDNLSSEHERARVTTLAAREGWTLVAMDRNAGFGGGVNAGVAAALGAGAEDVLVLNPDARIDADSIRALERAVARDRLTLASPVVKEASGRIWFGGMDVYLADGRMRATRRREAFPDAERWEWLSGACLWITREVWSKTGGFDHEYFLYWEDVDYSRRAVEAGIALAVVQDATAVHDEGATHRGQQQRTEAKSETYYYYNIRNRLLFAARHLDDEGQRRWARSAVRNARQVLLRGGRRQFLRPVAPLRAAWRGIRDGRRLIRTAGSRVRADAGG